MALLDRFRKKEEFENEGIEAVDGFDLLDEVIGRDEILKASEILQKYKSGKANLEQRIIANEEWYKLHNWSMIPHTPEQVQPTTAWLFNCIMNKHADSMDAFPTPNILPREEGDKAEAKKLTSIIPVILDQNDFEKTYSDVMYYKLVKGTGAYMVAWDTEKLDGKGDVSIKKADLLNLFWEPGITDIQDSRNLFHVQLIDNDLLEETYPQTKNRLTSPSVDVAKYIYDDTVDTSDKSVVVDWFYKRKQNGKTVLHYCKYVNDIVLYATENDRKRPTMPQIDMMTGEAVVDAMGNTVMQEIGESRAERGWYDHARYPFVFDVCFIEEGTPAGKGFIDVGKSPQEQIDRLNQCIVKNAYTNARPRYLVKDGCSINEKEFADVTKDFVHVTGNLTADSVLPMITTGLPSTYIQILNDKINELKETTGNRDVSNGGAPSGVTAASAVAALQESSSKGSRDFNRQSYRAYREVIYLVIELIRQFYDAPRTFRILGENGTEQFVSLSNKELQPQSQGTEFGIDLGMRTPVFDIKVTAEKSSPYTKLSQNELALQFLVLDSSIQK